MKSTIVAMSVMFALSCATSTLAQSPQNPPPSPIPNSSENSATNSDATSGKTVPPAQPSPPADTRKQSEANAAMKNCIARLKANHEGKTWSDRHKACKEQMKDSADEEHRDPPTR